MRIFFVLPLLLSTIACDTRQVAGFMKNEGMLDGTFPVAGRYRVTSQSPFTLERKSKESFLDVSTRAKFLARFAPGDDECPQMTTSVQGGQIEISGPCTFVRQGLRMTDIRKTGTYSRNFVELIESATVNGKRLEATTRYRLTKDGESSPAPTPLSVEEATEQALDTAAMDSTVVELPK